MLMKAYIQSVKCVFISWSAVLPLTPVETTFSHPRRNTVSYSAAISSCEKAGNWSVMLLLLENMFLAITLCLAEMLDVPSPVIQRCNGQSPMYSLYSCFTRWNLHLVHLSSGISNGHIWFQMSLDISFWWTKVLFACFGLGSLTKETSHSECIFSIITSKFFGQNCGFNR